MRLSLETFKSFGRLYLGYSKSFSIIFREAVQYSGQTAVYCVNLFREETERDKQLNLRE